ncbi:MAG: hypothetical protein ACYTA3_14555, partial [Planctomycetota bacterium]
MLRDEPGRKLASWTFSSPGDAEAFEAKGVIAAASVQDGALHVPPENDEGRVRALYFRPPVDLPPVFRFEVKLSLGQPKKHFPRGLLWKSARHPSFHKWRQAHKTVADVPEGSAWVASYDVIYWHGPIKRFRLDFADTDRPIRIDEISIYAPLLRTAQQGSGGMVWTEIDGVMMPSVWAASSGIEATVGVPENARLTFCTGLTAEAVADSGPAVTFRVLAAKRFSRGPCTRAPRSVHSGNPPGSTSAPGRGARCGSPSTRHRRGVPATRRRPGRSGEHPASWPSTTTSPRRQPCSSSWTRHGPITSRSTATNGPRR